MNNTIAKCFGLVLIMSCVVSCSSPKPEHSVESKNVAKHRVYVNMYIPGFDPCETRFDWNTPEDEGLQTKIQNAFEKVKSQTTPKGETALLFVVEEMAALGYDIEQMVSPSATRHDILIIFSKDL